MTSDFLKKEGGGGHLYIHCNKFGPWVCVEYIFFYLRKSILSKVMAQLRELGPADLKCVLHAMPFQHSNLAFRTLAIP